MISNFIKASDFVKRQTKTSRFSFFDGSFEELEKITEDYYKRGDVKNGYRDGVVLVSIMDKDIISRFKSNLVEIRDEDIFKTEYISRQDGEKPLRTSYIVNRDKEPAKYVDIVLYRHDVLEEDNDRSQDSEWEIISINAQNYEEVPMNPKTMARNQLHLVGGTKANYSGDEFAKAIIFWETHATTIGNILEEGDK